MPPEIDTQSVDGLVAQSINSSHDIRTRSPNAGRTRHEMFVHQREAERRGVNQSCHRLHRHHYAPVGTWYLTYTLPTTALHSSRLFLLVTPSSFTEDSEATPAGADACIMSGT